MLLLIVATFIIGFATITGFALALLGLIEVLARIGYIK